MEAELKLETNIPDVTSNKVLTELYDTVKKTETNVYTTINLHIKNQDYFTASSIIGMCKVLNEYYAPVWYYFNKPIGNPYSNMYNVILPPELVAYKTIIKKVLYTPAIEGGISFYKKTKLPILMYRKSKKSKKRKNKTKNTKKTRKITRKKRINKANK